MRDVITIRFFFFQKSIHKEIYQVYSIFYIFFDYNRNYSYNEMDYCKFFMLYKNINYKYYLID